jgi:hypothetical protein
MKLDRADHNHACGTQDNFVLNVWRRESLIENIQYLTALLERERAEHPEGFHLLQVVEYSAVVPNAVARAALAGMLRSGTGAIISSSVAFEGDGFQASMVRGVVTGLTMLAKPPFPHGVVASVRAALVVHARHAGIPLGDPLLERVEQAVAELRSAIDVAQTG